LKIDEGEDFDFRMKVPNHNLLFIYLLCYYYF
jgi:hypothetical protein